MNVFTGEIKNWDDLTPEQQQSGDWIKLPTDAGSVHRAQHEPGRGRIDRTFPKVDDGKAIDRLERAIHREESQFANRGHK